MTAEMEPGIHRIVIGKGLSPGQYPPNTYLLMGTQAAVLVDTGYDRDEETHERLAYLKQVCRLPLAALIVTHRHHDHMGGAPALHRATGAPIVAHRVEQGPIESQMKGASVGKVVEDGECLELGGLTVQYVHAPGHTLGSLVVFVPQRGALFTGDNVLGLGTTVISPEDGDLTLYLDSLRKMLALRPKTIYPGHGPVVHNAPAKLQGLLEHRVEREQQILELLAQAPQTVESLLAAVYPELHDRLRATARLQLRSHLLKLARESRVRTGDDGVYALA